jgi:hypothetical protein
MEKDHTCWAGEATRSYFHAEKCLGNKNLTKYCSFILSRFPTYPLEKVPSNSSTTCLHKCCTHGQVLNWTAQCLTEQEAQKLLILYEYYSKVQNVFWKADSHSACQQQLAYFMEPKGSLPRSLKTATGPYPEPAESSSPHQSLSL